MTAVLAPPVRICVSCGSVRDEATNDVAVAVNGKFLAGVVCADQEVCFAASDERWTYWPAKRKRFRVAEDIAGPAYVDQPRGDTSLLIVRVVQELSRAGALDRRHLRDACRVMQDWLDARPLCIGPGYLIEALIGAGLLVDVETPALTAHLAYEILHHLKEGASLHLAILRAAIVGADDTVEAEVAALTVRWSPWEASYRAAEVLMAAGPVGGPTAHWRGGRVAVARNEWSALLLSIDRDGTAHAWDHQASTWVPRLEPKP